METNPYQTPETTDTPPQRRSSILRTVLVVLCALVAIYGFLPLLAFPIVAIITPQRIDAQRIMVVILGASGGVAFAAMAVGLRRQKLAITAFGFGLFWLLILIALLLGF